MPTKVVSENLGHSSMGVTDQVYRHAVPAMLEEAVAKVAGAIFRTPV